jgi:tetratricopeptide (TPR) repeat protein
MPLSRRQFLASTAALPVLANLRGHPAFAEEPRHAPPYLALEKFIQPGFDEFAGEKQAAVISAELDQAFRTGTLKNEPSGQSPCPASYRRIAPDLREAVYNRSDTNVKEGWRRWVRFFKSVRRAQFYPLPDNIVRFEIAGEDQNGDLVYSVGRWRQRWNNDKLVGLLPLEEHVASAGKPWFRDVTASAFSNVDSFSAQLARGVPYWRARLDPASGIDIYGSNGISVGDIDNDGFDEIYVCQPGGLPNRLYRCDGNNLLGEITEEWGVGILDDTSAALFLDLRNIGRQDLVVLCSSGPLLFLNENGRFRMRDDAFRFATSPLGNFTGMAAADFDRDGKLDVYLCCYVYFQSEAQYTYASPYHDAQNGPPNFLFRNGLNSDGSGFFRDVTAETGMNENNNRFSFAPAWCDFNADGWPDLFVANDFGRKNLYVNRGGHFRDEAVAAGVEDIGPGMSAAWFDYDHDGKPDLYVANMWTAAGQRVIADAHFTPSHTDSLASAYQRHTMGNSLYQNRGDGKFEETTNAQSTGFGRWAWSSGGHDFDNDGEPEIFVTCGMLTNESTVDLSSFFWRQVVGKSPTKQQPSAAYENGWNAINQFIREEYSWNGREPNVVHVRRGDRYYDFSGVSGLDFADDSRAFAVTDFDGDGRPDLVVKSRLGPQLRILQNDCAESNSSIAFELRGTRSNRDAIGARIQVDRQTKWLDAGSGFLSQHTKRVLFGLGAGAAAKDIRITWPSGTEQRFAGLRVGYTYRITEGSPSVEPVPFKPAKRMAAEDVQADNHLQLNDTWFLEPVPLPEKQHGPGLFVLNEMPKSADRREQYGIFRRYLFDWRTLLTIPFALLLNADGQAVKIYANLPSETQVKADLAQLNQARRLALPFSGNYARPTHRDFFKFGAAYLWSGYTEQALPYLEQVLRRSPENVRVLVLVGRIHLEANRIDFAQKYFADARRINTNYAEAWSGLGDVCESRNNSREALENYERALSLKPDLLYTLLNAGRCADKLSLASKSEAFYRQAMQADPQSPEAANGLGLALAKQGQPQAASQLFQKAITLKRDYADAINNLGVLYVQETKINDAIAAFEYGIRVAPDEDILYLNLGRTYTRMGNVEKARQVMHELLDRKPGNSTALHALQELDGR